RLRPRPVLRNAERSDDGGRALGLPQKTTGLPDTPTESAPARPGSPVRFATALSTSTSPHPHLRATTQSPAATLPKPSVLRPQCPRTYQPQTPHESLAYDNFHGIDSLVIGLVRSTSSANSARLTRLTLLRSCDQGFANPRNFISWSRAANATNGAVFGGRRPVAPLADASGGS